MSLRLRILLLLIFIILVLSIFISRIALVNAERIILTEATQYLSAIADSKEGEIETFIQSHFDQVRGISSRTKLRNTLQSYNSEPNEEAIDTINEILLDAEDPFENIENIILYDKNIRIVTSTNGLISNHEADDIKKFLKKSSINESILVSKNQEKMYIGGPVFLGNELLGFVVFENDIDPWNNVFTSYRGLGETGEVFVARRNEVGDAAFIHARRFEDHPDALSVIDKSALEVPITQALLKNETVLANAIDYRGKEVIAVTRYLEVPDWGLAVKVDIDELRALFSDLEKVLSIITLSVMVVSGVIAYIIATTIVRPIELLTTKSKSVQQGELDITLPDSLLNDKSELGVLSQNFKEMVSAVSDAKSGLEDKVIERTSELEKAKAELEGHVKELERWQKVTEGRELRMIELKKKIKQLEKKNRLGGDTHE